MATALVVSFTLPLPAASVAEWLCAWLDRELPRGPAGDEPWRIVALVHSRPDGSRLQLVITDADPDADPDPEAQRIELHVEGRDAWRLRAAIARDLVALWAHATDDSAPLYPFGPDAPDPRGGVRGAHTASPCPVGAPSPNGVHRDGLPSRGRDLDRWKETWRQLRGRFGTAPSAAESLRFLEAHYPALVVNRHALKRLIEAGARGELDD